MCDRRKVAQCQTLVILDGARVPKSLTHAASGLGKLLHSESGCNPVGIGPNPTDVRRKRSQSCGVDKNSYVSSFHFFSNVFARGASVIGKSSCRAKKLPLRSFQR